MLQDGGLLLSVACLRPYFVTFSNSISVLRNMKHLHRKANSSIKDHVLDELRRVDRASCRLISLGEVGASCLPQSMGAATGITPLSRWGYFHLGDYQA